MKPRSIHLRLCTREGGGIVYVMSNLSESRDRLPVVGIIDDQLQYEKALSENLQRISGSTMAHDAKNFEKQSSLIEMLAPDLVAEMTVSAMI